VLSANGASTTVALVDTGEQDGKAVEQDVRETDLDGIDLKRLSIEYRHGLAQVSADAVPVLNAWISNGRATIAGTMTRASMGTLSLKRFAASALQSEARVLTKLETQQVAEAEAANREMISLYGKGKVSEAAERGERALEIRKSVLGEQHSDHAQSLNNLAVLYERMADYAQAEPLYKEAMETRQAVFGETHPEYATSLNNLASLYETMGDYARAEPLYKQALEIRKSVFGEMHPEYATSLNNLASLYHSKGETARAESLYKRSLEIRKPVLGETHPDYAASLNNLAGLYYSIGETARAEPLYRQCMEIQKSVLGEKHPRYVGTLNNLAALYHRIGDTARAEPLYSQAREIWRSVLGENHPNYATSLNNQAFLFLSMGNTARAESLYRQAIEIRTSVFGEKHPNYAQSISSLAWLYHSMGDTAQAEPLIRMAAGTIQENLDQSSLVLSERQQKRNQSRKRPYLDSRLTIAQQSDAQANDALQTLWQWKGAVTFRQQAYRHVASNPKLAPVFDSLQSVSRQLSAVSSRVPIPPADRSTDAEGEVYHRKRELWDQQFASLSRQREDLEQQIAADSAEFRESREPLTVAEVQNLLPTTTAFVDFLDYNHATPNPDHKGKMNYQRRYIAFVVRPDHEPAMIGLGSVESIGDAVTAFRRPLVLGQNSNAIRQAAAKAGRQLRKQLWLPIEQYLNGIETVLVSPDTVLGTLPFAALPGKKANSYLLEDYKLANLPLARLLPRLMMVDASRRDDHGLLVLGDVNYDSETDSKSESQFDTESFGLLALAGEQGRLKRSRGVSTNSWNALPGFRAEMTTVQSLHRKRFGADAPVATLTGTAATEDSLLNQASRFQTLHLITHGFFSDPAVQSIDQADVKQDGFASNSRAADPFINTWMPGLLSGLVMAGANASSDDPEDLDDGILRASEIEASSMQGVDLVVLSACETGLGAVAGGEGLAGLQRAFHMAGARSVIASLWKVDDRGTLELMRRFYTNLWQHNMSKIDALREAQLWMLRHPKELEEMGVKGAATRGKIRDLKNNDRKNTEITAAAHTDPYFWAAFQLSGDWR
jgi:CHAT domain-containing protein/Tfp pilus assembly protein PilF